MQQQTAAQRAAIHHFDMRWHVLQRDRFTCCACGASPALTLGVELHVDHIVPWSKGGKTVLANLQTLCSVCNLGKSNVG
jgi:5-methylcytosine-specific restriction endonuclease McrA